MHIWLFTPKLIQAWRHFCLALKKPIFSYWLRKATFFFAFGAKFLLIYCSEITLINWKESFFWLNHSLSQITWIANPYPGLWVCHLYSHCFSSTLFEFADQDQDCLINKFLFVALFTHIFLYFNKLISHLLSCHSELTQHWICSLIAVFIWTLCA